MNQFKRVNTWGGWIVFAIALLTYFLTLEPSVSFWDCGEFIACADKLQVGHPPGAPLYLMLARLFAVFAPDVTKTAVFVNSLSALCSALTILFLFWTITHMGRRLIQQNRESLTKSQTISVIGAGAVGALAFTFSDSFWFSAVEAEVYAMSSLFTAFVFWAILKWEEEADEPFANRWLVLIAYAMGLSLGVHLLNLLAIPAIVLVVYFKKYKFSYGSFFLALLIAIAILGGILKFILSGLLTVASWVELLFVNEFGFHYNSGLLFFLFLVFAALAFGVYRTYKNGKVFWNTVLLSTTVMLIGFSSYAMIIIRAHALTPMNNNEATNVFSLLSYLNREQYGQKPLFVGQYFNADLVSEKPFTIKDDVYAFWKGKYEKAYKKYDYNYEKTHTTFFPRMYSSERAHKYGYERWSSVDAEQKKTPTFVQNLEYFFSYQLSHMYFRYFMWNFSGRQNGEQGHGSLSKGNWITGIPFIDAVKFGNQSKLPEFMKKDPSRNEYYMLPLLLGLIGIVFQLSKGAQGGRSFLVTFLLFFLTGIAIVLFVNQTAYQPRERDYSYAGSFYAFCIWIGLGALAVGQFLSKHLGRGGELGAVVGCTLCLLFVPVLMAQQNWDDHDRSGRYWAHDVGQNYLMSANDKNSILFCYGDNDSFPLWYNQDVEGFRTDVRVCNLSYLQSVWFIAQMQRKSYESLPMPISMNKSQYRDGVRDQIVIEQTSETEALEKAGGVDLKTAVDFMKNDRYLAETITGRKLGRFVTNHFKLPVNRMNVLRGNLVPREFHDEVQEEIRWNLGGETSIMKQNLAIYDALAHNNWERTFYFTSTINESLMQGLNDYKMITGLAHKLVPIKTSGDNPLKKVDVEQMYQNVMHEFKWGNVANENVYLDTDNLYAAKITLENINDLVDVLLYRKEDARAVEVLDFAIAKLPYEKLRYHDGMERGYRDIWIRLVQRYFVAGEYEKGERLLNKIGKDILEMREYYSSMSAKAQEKYGMELIRLNNTLGVLGELQKFKEKKQVETVEKDTLEQEI